MSVPRVPSALVRALLQLCLGAFVLAPVLAACESKLPGPLQCERMAVGLVIGKNSNLINDERAQRLVERVTNGCLTSPFDLKMVACVEQTKDFRRCLDDLEYRAPERGPALQALRKRINLR